MEMNIGEAVRCRQPGVRRAEVFAAGVLQPPWRCSERRNPVQVQQEKSGE